MGNLKGNASTGPPGQGQKFIFILQSRNALRRYSPCNSCLLEYPLQKLGPQVFCDFLTVCGVNAAARGLRPSERRHSLPACQNRGGWRCHVVLTSECLRPWLLRGDYCCLSLLQRTSRMPAPVMFQLETGLFTREWRRKLPFSSGRCRRMRSRESKRLMADFH